jgi:hypothetical protein
VNYNIPKLDISNGLNNVQISSGMNYLILIDAPANANVRIRLNDSTADEIPIEEKYAIKTKDVKNIYVSADAIEGRFITFAQGNTADDFEIVTNPYISSIDDIGNVQMFGEQLLSKLDKIMNPFNDWVNLVTFHNTTSSSVQIFNAVCDFDELQINTNLVYLSSVGSASMPMYLDGDLFFYPICYSTNPDKNIQQKITVRDIRGKRLAIYGSGYVVLHMEKRTLKQ